MSDRDYTVAGLIRHLQGIVEAFPPVAEYDVVLNQAGEEVGTRPWNGKTYRWDDTKTLEVETSA